MPQQCQYCFTPKTFPDFHKQPGTSPCLHSLNSTWFFCWTFILDGLFWKPKLRKKRNLSSQEVIQKLGLCEPRLFLTHTSYWVVTTRNVKWDGSLFQKCCIISSSHHPLYLHLISLRVIVATVARHSKSIIFLYKTPQNQLILQVIF